MKTLNELLSNNCPHCAISEFLQLWEARHEDVSPQKLLGSFCEVTADYLIDFDDKSDRINAALWTGELFLKFIKEVVDGTYKADAVVIGLDGKPEGGLH